MISSSQRPLPDNTQHSQQTSMPSVGFEPTISAGERPQTYALDRAVTETGSQHVRVCNLLTLWTEGLVVPRVDLKALETRKYSFFCAENNPKSRFFLSRFLFTVPTNRVGQTSKIKVYHFPFIGLNSSLVADEKGCGADGSQLQSRECSRKRLLEILNVIL